MRRFLAASLGLAALAGCGRDNARAIDEARRLMESSPPDYRGAQVLLNAVIERTADDASPRALTERRDALVLRGEIFKQNNWTEAAAADLRLVAESIDPGFPNALAKLSATLSARGNPELGDFDRAIEYGEKAIRGLAESEGDRIVAAVAVGSAYLGRSSWKRDSLARELRSISGGGSQEETEKELAAVLSLPETHPRSIAFRRELERRFEGLNPDSQDRALAELASAREDRLAATQFMVEAIAVFPYPEAMWNYLRILAGTGRLDEAVCLARFAVREKTQYRNHPYLIEAASEVLEQAGLLAEAVEVLTEYAERGIFPLTIEGRRRVLRAAAATKNPEVLRRTITRLKKRPGRGFEGAVLRKMIDYYDTVLLELEGSPPDKIVSALRPFVIKQDADVADLLDDAAVRLIRALQKTHGELGDGVEGSRPESAASGPASGEGWLKQALDYADIGVGADSNNAELLALRAGLRLRTGENPIRYGGDVRTAMVADPAHAERVYPLLRMAADRAIAKGRQSLEGLEADALARGGIPTGFNEAWIYYVFARDFLAQGHPAEACASALETLSRDSSFVPALAVVGLARAKMGQMREARSAFEQAGRGLPLDPALCLAIAESGAAPPDIRLRLLVARPETEGRLALAQSALLQSRWEEADRVIRPLAAQPDAPWEALLLDAHLAAGVGRTDFEPILARMPRGTRGDVLAEQLRLETALNRGSREQADAVAARIRGIKDSTQSLLLPRLLATAERARDTREGARAAVPAARLLADSSAKESRVDAYELLAHVLLEAGELRPAAEAFDRLVGIRSGPQSPLWLGLTLHALGDAPGVGEALSMTRKEWGARPPDLRRAALAALAGSDPTAEELEGAKPKGLDDPLLVTVYAALHVMAKGTSPGADYLPRVTPWIDAAVRFVGSDKARAARVLRLAIALRTTGGPRTALEELAALRTAEDAPLAGYFEAEALGQLPGRVNDEIRLYVAAAEALPDLDAAWERALEAAHEQGNEGLADRIAGGWLLARPAQPAAAIGAAIQAARLLISRKQKLAEVEAGLAAQPPAMRARFEVALTLLLARTMLGKSAAMVESATDVARIAESSPRLAARAVGPVIDAFVATLPGSTERAREVADRMARLMPAASEPVRLKVACDLAEGRIEEAGRKAIDYFRAQQRLESISVRELRLLVDLLAPRNPEAATEIARLAVAALPADAERWQIFADQLRPLGRLGEATEILEAICVADAKTPLRRFLATLQSYPGQSPERAVELFDDPNGPPLSPDDRLARARALRLVGFGAAAVEALEGILAESAPASGPAASRPARSADMEMALALATRAREGDLGRACAKLGAIVALAPAESADLALFAKALRFFSYAERKSELLPPTYGEAASRPASAPDPAKPH